MESWKCSSGDEEGETERFQQRDFSRRRGTLVRGGGEEQMELEMWKVVDATPHKSLSCSLHQPSQAIRPVVDVRERKQSLRCTFTYWALTTKYSDPTKRVCNRIEHGQMQMASRHFKVRSQWLRFKDWKRMIFVRGSRVRAGISLAGCSWDDADTAGSIRRATDSRNHQGKYRLTLGEQSTKPPSKAQRFTDRGCCSLSSDCCDTRAVPTNPFTAVSEDCVVM